MLVDPKGQIPASLVNNVLGNRAHFFSNLREKLLVEFAGEAPPKTVVVN
jgi:hypothetical protein